MVDCLYIRIGRNTLNGQKTKCNIVTQNTEVFGRIYIYLYSLQCKMLLIRFTLSEPPVLLYKTTIDDRLCVTIGEVDVCLNNNDIQKVVENFCCSLNIVLIAAAKMITPTKC